MMIYVVVLTILTVIKITFGYLRIYAGAPDQNGGGRPGFAERAFDCPLFNMCVVFLFPIATLGYIARYSSESLHQPMRVFVCFRADVVKILTVELEGDRM